MSQSEDPEKTIRKLQDMLAQVQRLEEQMSQLISTIVEKDKSRIRKEALRRLLSRAGAVDAYETEEWESFGPVGELTAKRIYVQRWAETLMVNGSVTR